MAADDNKGGPKKLDRRDVLKGLSTLPALGLFGYAWEKQRAYQQARVAEVTAPLGLHGPCLTIATACSPRRPPTCR